MNDEGDSDILSDSDTSDDELELILQEKQIKNDLEELVSQYSTEEFCENFRLSRDIVNNISNRFHLSRYFHYQSGQYGNIPALNQVLIYLWYMGHHSVTFRDVVHRFKVTVSSVNRIIQRVTSFLSNLSPEVIVWPNETEKRISEEHFRENGFPNTIGAIDGCHIKIDKPEIDPDCYINQMGYYSVQMQGVCDHQGKLLDVFIGYPGSVQDSTIYQSSPIGNNLEEKCGRYYIIGDLGFPLQKNLLTPYKDGGNLSRRQQFYNAKHAKNRYIIEHCFGMLKQKFRQIFHVKLRNISLIVHFIRAACVLYNISIDDNFIVNNEHHLPIQRIPYAENENDEDDYDDEDEEARTLRDKVANTL